MKDNSDTLKNEISKLIDQLSKDYGGKTENQYIVQKLQKIIGVWKP